MSGELVPRKPSDDVSQWNRGISLTREEWAIRDKHAKDLARLQAKNHLEAVIHRQTSRQQVHMQEEFIGAATTCAERLKEISDPQVQEIAQLFTGTSLKSTGAIMQGIHVAVGEEKQAILQEPYSEPAPPQLPRRQGFLDWLLSSVEEE